MIAVRAFDGFHLADIRYDNTTQTPTVSCSQGALSLPAGCSNYTNNNNSNITVLAKVASRLTGIQLCGPAID
jgi:hypothetical protein